MSQAYSIPTRAKQAGDHAPDFCLTNHLGEPVHLEELCRQGPVVVAFYRGSWCEHGMRELRSLRDALPGLQEAGVLVMAISPEVPRQTRATRHKLTLEFDVLSDISNVVARRFGLVYQLDRELMTTYEQSGIDLVDHNGDDSYELPVPATYLIDQFGVIRHAAVDTERRRTGSVDLLAATKQLAVGSG